MSAIEAEVVRRIRSELLAGEDISNVVGFGVFGSYARGDYSRISDIDIFVVVKRGVPKIRRVEIDNTIVDIEYIPEQFFSGIYPAYHKIMYEAKIIYDPNGILTTACQHIKNVYWSPTLQTRRNNMFEREAISFIAKSRNAIEHRDLESSLLYLRRAMRMISKLICNKAKTIYVPSRSLESLWIACQKMKVIKFYTDYLRLSNLENLEDKEVDEIVRNASLAFKRFREMSKHIRLHDETLRSWLNFFANPLYERGYMEHVREALFYGNLRQVIELTEYYLGPLMVIFESIFDISYNDPIRYIRDRSGLPRTGEFTKVYVDALRLYGDRESVLTTLERVKRFLMRVSRI